MRVRVFSSPRIRASDFGVAKGGGGSATLRTLVGLLDGSRDAPRLLRDWQRALGVNAAPHPDALERALRLLAGQGLLAD